MFRPETWVLILATGFVSVAALLPSTTFSACFLHGHTCFSGNTCTYPYNAVDPRVTCMHGKVCCEVPPCDSYCVNGTCLSEVCTCDEGFSGIPCDIDVCADNGDCVNGTCVRLPDGQHNCSCDDGFSGDTCETDACADNGDCVNGTCVRLADGQHNCSCDDGFYGDTCAIDACENNGNCVNGTCVRISDDPYYSCDCDLAYSDYNCSFLNWTCTFLTQDGLRADDAGIEYVKSPRTIEECEALCLEDLDCLVADFRLPSSSCRIHYSVNDAVENNNFVHLTKRCAVTCDPMCINGLCQEDEFGNRSCQCDPGFYGDICQYDACENNGNCVNGTCVRISEDPYYSCDCELGYSDYNCSFLNWTCTFFTQEGLRADDAGIEYVRSPRTIEECEALCLEDLDCLVADFRLPSNSCRIHYSINGVSDNNNFVHLTKRCAVTCDPMCIDGLCQEDEFGNRSCQCDPGFYGDICEYDACEPDPCDEGTCVGTTSDPFFSCSCNPGFGGDNCSVQVCDFTEVPLTRPAGSGRSNYRSDFTIEECKRHCLDDETCVAAEYNTFNSRCWRWKNTLPSTAYHAKFTWMPKTCDP